VNLILSPQSLNECTDQAKTNEILFMHLLKILIFVEGEKLLYSLFYHSATAVQIGANKILMLNGKTSELVADML
jgi:hypothetical protein